MIVFCGQRVTRAVILYFRKSHNINCHIFLLENHTLPCEKNLKMINNTLYRKCSQVFKDGHQAAIFLSDVLDEMSVQSKNNIRKGLLAENY